MTTLERLTHLIHDKFGVELDAIDPDAPFASYNLGDLLTVAELMFEIDDAFQVDVLDEAAHSATTLRQLATLIDGSPAWPARAEHGHSAHRRRRPGLYEVCSATPRRTAGNAFLRARAPSAACRSTALPTSPRRRSPS